MHNPGADSAFSISGGSNVYQGLKSYGGTTRRKKFEI